MPNNLLRLSICESVAHKKLTCGQTDKIVFLLESLFFFLQQVLAQVDAFLVSFP